MDAVFWGYYESPVGLLEIGGTETAIVAVNFVEQRRADVAANVTVETAVAQLAEYFSGTRTMFDVPLAPEGTDFQKMVWQELRNIPYGQTASYGDIANSIGKPKASRAVGAANGKNPIPIIVPCHRIIGSNGKLTGYGGGLWRKEWLLKHEGILESEVH
ncbi:MAG: methylated-DNA--[protein]-cysteine S-methyltransferase [Anaerolineae bacterium]|nr:methylated-DNA--[protein]-cysteine S-methyltransferase [Anaerolineae bacterium]